MTADHGEGLGDHQEKEHGLFVYNETIRVPLLIKLPNSRRGGTRIADPVQHIDLLPTLTGLAAITAPVDRRGRDLQPLLFGRGTIRAEGIYAEAMYPRYHFGWSELTSLTDGRYKYIKAPTPELYDLERDPHERENIATTRGQQATALKSGLETSSPGADSMRRRPCPLRIVSGSPPSDTSARMPRHRPLRVRTCRIRRPRSASC